ncbi:hypothetical protein FHS89_000840 [Rubricella aquisinus]|uniref:Nickel/cobalt transporter regulator n=1 Tax=Rubricella aquisinus TaxID=2028108 RepID=A0A840WWX3_9RHOB|nr:excinuclease ABC subunit A [Rubricella aquisinus]MBB5514834.1 hypothetical protein [Rubricella aquisinus]
MKRAIPFIALLALATAPAAYANGPEHCPPGLAKKTPACIPPGQAMKYEVGDRIAPETDRRIIRDWEDLGLPRPGEDEIYIALPADNEIVRVLQDGLIVVEAIGILDQWLN